MGQDKGKTKEKKQYAKYPFLLVVCCVSLGFTLIEIVLLFFSSALPMFLSIITLPLLLVVLIVSAVLACFKRMHWIIPLLIAILFLTWLYVLFASVFCTLGLHAERGPSTLADYTNEHIYNYRFIYVQEIDNVYDEYGLYLSNWSVTRIYPCINTIYNIGLFVTILVLYIRERKNIKSKEGKENK